MSARLLLAVATSLLAGCSNLSLDEGLDEPLAVQNAQFTRGELPGKPPVSNDETPAQPYPSAALTYTSYLRQGLAAVNFTGTVPDSALSVAVQVKDQGTGYWVLPTGLPDQTRPGFLTYGFTADFHQSLAPGNYDLLVAAVDEDGKAGTQSVSTLCINSLVPDNGNVCLPSTQPPDLVVSLKWDAPVDLDLVVVTPTGKIVSSKNPTTAEKDEDGSLDTTAPGVGNIDLDSNKDCVLDGRQRENLVFQTVPRNSKFKLFVNLARSCGQAAVRYELSYHGRVPGETKGTFGVRSEVRAEGTLVDDQANGGTESGTYILDLDIGE